MGTFFEQRPRTTPSHDSCQLWYQFTYLHSTHGGRVRNCSSGTMVASQPVRLHTCVGWPGVLDLGASSQSYGGWKVNQFVPRVQSDSFFGWCTHLLCHNQNSYKTMDNENMSLKLFRFLFNGARPAAMQRSWRPSIGCWCFRIWTWNCPSPMAWWGPTGVTGSLRTFFLFECKKNLIRNTLRGWCQLEMYLLYLALIEPWVCLFGSFWPNFQTLIVSSNKGVLRLANHCLVSNLNIS